MLRRAGVQCVRFNDGSCGLINVPAKYVAVIDSMHVAMIHLLNGEPLPEFLPEKERLKNLKKARKEPSP